MQTIHASIGQTMTSAPSGSRNSDVQRLEELLESFQSLEKASDTPPEGKSCLSALEYTKDALSILFRIGDPARLRSNDKRRDVVARTWRKIKPALNLAIRAPVERPRNVILTPSSVYGLKLFPSG
eukprot:1393608-Amorphochlora_amoeboformis.AAC.2